jgi:hypothetical protein
MDLGESWMPLDYEGVMAARAEELEVFRKFEVYHNVKLKECYEVTQSTDWIKMGRR